MQGRRIDRIEEQFRMEISAILEREIQDPRIRLVTITAVKVAPDMSHARVLISSLGDAEQRKKTLQGLKSGASFMRRSLSKRLHHLRRIPELTFDYDDSLEKENRIEELFNQIRTDEE